MAGHLGHPGIFVGDALRSQMFPPTIAVFVERNDGHSDHAGRMDLHVLFIEFLQA